MADIELAHMSRKLQGYPSLSEHVANDGDHTSLIFNRFDKLAARNLLYLQSELADLQEQLEDFDREDAGVNAVETAKECARSWTRFEELSGTDDGVRKRLDLAMKIRATLKEYRKALHYEREMAELEKPSEHRLQLFQDSFMTGRDRIPVLTGPSGRLYEDSTDLMALKVPRHDDRLTAMLKEAFPSSPRKQRQARTSPSFFESAYGVTFDQAIDMLIPWVSGVLSMFSALILLIGAIFGLYFVNSDMKRMGMMSMFAVLFVGAVGLFTNAKRSEIFASASAYVGVLIVFVGSAPFPSPYMYSVPNGPPPPAPQDSVKAGASADAAKQGSGLSADGVSAVVIGVLALVVAIAGVYLTWKSIKIALRALGMGQTTDSSSNP
ncbi:hypothetical protein BDV96DRAFT_649248 [Lophiotrema nucula]|uniref:DUF6594 domain-containing protein n=1 Tax=Lophiotrema nucula TaxID=690887 RepID=A0A6A5Z084_9PLEO|nr:hypothetical protein BDV96DRAFT_649248 [Lophiotrema nucula]